jgi:hypothetical protein
MKKNIFTILFAISVVNSFGQKRDISFEKEAISYFLKNKNIQSFQNANTISIQYKDGLKAMLKIEKKDYEQFNTINLEIKFIISDSLDYFFQNSEANAKNKFLKKIKGVFSDKQWILMEDFIDSAFRSMESDFNNPNNLKIKKGFFVAIGVNPNLGDELYFELKKVNKGLFELRLTYNVST